MSQNILRIDASMRDEGSLSRQIADTLIHRLRSAATNSKVVQRDLARGIELVNAHWIDANFTDPNKRTCQQRSTLAYSDALVAELKNANTLVIATPIYNFGVPAALKAWVDMVARARETFRYTPDGPRGLLAGKKAYVVVVSGGTVADSEIDFATPYLRHALSFIGITDVEVIAANAGDGADKLVEHALAQIDSLLAA